MRTQLFSVAGLLACLCQAHAAEDVDPTTCTQKREELRLAEESIDALRDRVKSVQQRIEELKRYPNRAPYIPAAERELTQAQAAVGRAEKEPQPAREAVDLCASQAAERAAKERARVEDERAKLERDPRSARVLLSAKVCLQDRTLAKARRDLAQHLAHPTIGDDYNEQIYELRETIVEANRVAMDMRARLRRAGMGPLPCGGGEVKQILLCIASDRDEALCRKERMQAVLEQLEDR